MKTKLMLFLALAFGAGLIAAAPLGTAITYQGRLTDGGSPAAGNYDLRFAIYDAGEGNAIAGPLTNAATGITNGLFTVTLDFGDGVFTGAARWLEVGVRTAGSTGDFTPLAPRQPLTAAPYALHAPTAGIATTVTGAVLASQITGTISSNNIGVGSITPTMLAAGAVGPDHLAAGAVTSDKLFRTTAITPTRTIPNPAPATSDAFGRSVAFAGSNRILIGTPADDLGATDAGTACLFDLGGNLLATCTNPTPAAGDLFAFAVAGVGTDRVLISAHNDDTGAANSGAAYLFNLSGALITTYINPTPAADDCFGTAVTGVGNNRVLIGAPGDDRGATDAGAAYLFDLSGGLITTYTNPMPAMLDSFGSAVAALDEHRVIISAPFDFNGVTFSGAAHLFDLAGQLLTTFTNPTPANQDMFGYAVAGVGAERILIGAPRDGTGAANSGAAYLFNTNGVLLATITNPAPAVSDWFGSSVAALGTDRILIGAYFDDTGATNAGFACLFDLSGNLMYTFTNPAPELNGYFGIALAGLDSSHIVIGSANSPGASHAGAACLYNVDKYTPGLVADAIRTGGVTADSIANGQVVRSLNGLTDALTLAAGPNVTITPSGNTLQIAAVAGTNAVASWGLTGNSNTLAGVNFLGTTDNQPLELVVNRQRALRLQPANHSPNVIGGYSGNSIGSGVIGGTIAGGGSPRILPLFTSFPNAVNADFGSVLGGRGNTVTGFAGTVAGGQQNVANGYASFAAGTGANALHEGSFVWSDTSGGDFPSTTNHQFLIRAAGGVGIGTTSPQAALDVNGGINYSGTLGKLDTTEQWVANVRAADFFFGHSTRRGMPGRALVDFADTLEVNFSGDWAKTKISGYVIMGDVEVTKIKTPYIDMSDGVRIQRKDPYTIEMAGNVFVNGNLEVTALKWASVDTSQGRRGLAAEESAQVWFTDYGFGRLDQGHAVIQIDPLFAETVNLNEPYHVFVQVNNADCEGMAVLNKTPTAFEVRELRKGKSDSGFSYRLVALRRGYEHSRLPLTRGADESSAKSTAR